MNKIKTLLLTFCLPLVFVACDGQGSEADVEREQALTDYRNFVTEFEQDSLSEVEMRALQQSAEDDSRWETEKANLEEEYYEKRRVIETNLEELKEEERAEVDELELRYNRAMQLREQQYTDAVRRVGLRNQLLGLEIKDEDMSDVTAQNIAQVYERFVTNMAGNTAEYETYEWNLVEGWWSALNSRYRSLEDKLSAPVKAQIQQFQNRYKELRDEASIDNA